jgi:hypothetical protein
LFTLAVTVTAQPSALFDPLTLVGCAQGIENRLGWQEASSSAGTVR